jgi:hypothetical protein
MRIQAANDDLMTRKDAYLRWFEDLKARATQAATTDEQAALKRELAELMEEGEEITRLLILTIADQRKQLGKPSLKRVVTDTHGGTVIF